MKHRYGEGYVFPRGGKRNKYGKLKTGSWWICYFRNGVMHRESGHTLVKTQAYALLKQRNAEIVTGVFVSTKDLRITVDDLYQGLLWSYRDKANLRKITQYWQDRNIPRSQEDSRSSLAG